MKMETKKFEGQLSGSASKEKYFAELRKDYKISLPEVGAKKTVTLKPEALNGAFLSILDGPASLKVDGVAVAKTKVYAGDVGIPVKFDLSFTVNRVSDACTKLSAELTSK